MPSPTLSTFESSDGGAGDDAGRTVEPAALLELLEDDYARRILDAVADEPRPARELMDVCDASRATVYRRLNRLEERNLVASRTAVHPDGHHRKVFEATLEEATIVLGEDGISAEVTVATAGDDPMDTPGRRPPVRADD